MTYCDCCENEMTDQGHTDPEYGSVVCDRCFEELGGTMAELPREIFESPEEAAALEAQLDAEFPDEGRRYHRAVKRILDRRTTYREEGDEN